MFFPAVVADTAYFGAADGDFDSTIARNLALYFLVQFTFEFADFAAFHAGYVDVVARAVAFVVMAVAAQVQQVEFVDQTLALQQIERAIDGDARDGWIDFLRAFQNFGGVEVAAGSFHHLQQDAALFGQANAAGAECLLQVARGFVVDAFAGGYAMFGCGGHGVYLEYSKCGVRGALRWSAEFCVGWWRVCYGRVKI